jgi:ketosteroid isomerase-like protein
MAAINVKKAAFLLVVLLSTVGAQLFGSVQLKNEQNMETVSVGAQDAESAIRALEAKFVAAFNAGDIDAMMKNYIPDKSLVVFDVVLRKQYLGADAYRDDWMEFFSHFQGKPKIEITDLGVTADDNIGFGHSFQHVTGINKQGQPVDRWVRVTDGYRKIGGKWLIVMEHISVPVDLKTGKAGLTWKP